MVLAPAREARYIARAAGEADARIAAKLPDLLVPGFVIFGLRIRACQEDVMSSPVYKSIELTGTSSESVEDAVRSALEKASKSVRNIRWFEVTETRGTVDKNTVGQWQVSIKAGFTLED